MHWVSLALHALVATRDVVDLSASNNAGRQEARTPEPTSA